MAKYILPQCITEVKAKIIKLEENLNDFLWLSKTVPKDVLTLISGTCKYITCPGSHLCRCD